MTKKKFKKIYVEITNVCNLSCPFCLELKRKKEFMSLDKFQIVLDNASKFTNYLYLHIKGEPLIHPDFNNILKLCDAYNMKVNLTTNGTLIKENFDVLKNSKAIRQINISIHALSLFDENTQFNYLNEIIKLIEYATNVNHFCISLRFWLGSNQKQSYAKEILESYFGTKICNSMRKIQNNIYVSFDEEFTWPEAETASSRFIYCHGIKDHIGILVDGTVVPCCLDGNGVINLGNIFTTPLANILSSERYQKMLQAFSTRAIDEELCKKCSFKNKFAKIG